MEISEFTTPDSWTYRVIHNENYEYDFEIVDPNKTSKPEFLFKHFSLNTNAVNTLVKKYLFASHPLQLNDPYDCNRYIFDFNKTPLILSLIHISEPTRQAEISYAVFCLKKKK